MTQLVALTVFAILLARVLRAPAGTWRYIVGAAFLVLVLAQLLPEASAFRQEAWTALTLMFWLGVAGVPIGAYALLVRQIRRRTGIAAERAAAAGPARRPRGLVLILDDAALAEDTAAALAAEGRGRGETLSIGWRDERGGLAGHARLRLEGELAEVEMLWVRPAARGRGIGGKLVAQAAEEARRRGARALIATVRGAEAARFLARRGFRPCGSLAAGPGAQRLHLRRALA